MSGLDLWKQEHDSSEDGWGDLSDDDRATWEGEAQKRSAATPPAATPAAPRRVGGTILDDAAGPVAVAPTPAFVPPTPAAPATVVNGVTAPPGMVVTGAGQVVPAPAQVSAPLPTPPVVTIGGDVSAGIPGVVGVPAPNGVISSNNPAHPGVLASDYWVTGDNGERRHWVNGVMVARIPASGASGGTGVVAPPAAALPPGANAPTPAMINAIASRMNLAAQGAIDRSNAQGVLFEPIIQPDGTWSYQMVTDAAHPNGIPTIGSGLTSAQIGELAARTAVALAAARGWIEDPTTHERIRTPASLLISAQIAHENAATTANEAEAAYTKGARTTLTDAQAAATAADTEYTRGARTDLTNAQRDYTRAQARKEAIDAAYQRGVATGIFIDPETGQQTTTLASKKNDADIRESTARSALLAAQTTFENARVGIESARLTGTIRDPLTGQIVSTLDAQKQAFEQAAKRADLASNPRNYLTAAMLGTARGGLAGQAPTNQVTPTTTAALVSQEASQGAGPNNARISELERQLQANPQYQGLVRQINAAGQAGDMAEVQRLRQMAAPFEAQLREYSQSFRPPGASAAAPAPVPTMTQDQARSILGMGASAGPGAAQNAAYISPERLADARRVLEGGALVAGPPPASTMPPGAPDQQVGHVRGEPGVAGGEPGWGAGGVGSVGPQEDWQAVNERARLRMAAAGANPMGTPGQDVAPPFDANAHVGEAVLRAIGGQFVGPQQNNPAYVRQALGNWLKGQQGLAARMPGLVNQANIQAVTQALGRLPDENEGARLQWVNERGTTGRAVAQGQAGVAQQYMNERGLSRADASSPSDTSQPGPGEDRADLFDQGVPLGTPGAADHLATLSNPSTGAQLHYFQAPTGANSLPVTAATRALLENRAIPGQGEIVGPGGGYADPSQLGAAFNINKIRGQDYARLRPSERDQFRAYSSAVGGLSDSDTEDALRRSLPQFTFNPPRVGRVGVFQAA